MVRNGHDDRRHRRLGAPGWYDDENAKRCQHDQSESEPEIIRSETGHSDFSYFRLFCGHSDCDETWDYWVKAE